ncbi:hypothetical protein [uncultured Nonlabens sp.]|uniref:hypothetical protein n=1 Tax=uncultured Nonlabens sp. TaxID=859306 RepID=UPI0030DA0891|tara:strand:+ start:27442 stop:28416 length:975 start_codon:yes stop_codon:yes gene_type:complete
MQYILDYYTESIKLLASTYPNYFDNFEDRVKGLLANTEKRFEKRTEDFIDDFKELDVNNIQLANSFVELLLNDYSEALRLKEQLGIGMHGHILTPYGTELGNLISDLKKYLINWHITYGEAVNLDEFFIDLEVYYEKHFFYSFIINDDSEAQMNQLNQEIHPDWEPLTRLLFDLNNINSDKIKELGINLSDMMNNLHVRLLTKGVSRAYKDNSPYINNFKDSVQELYKAFEKNSLIDIEFDQFLILLTANSENIPINQKIHLDSTRLNVPNKVVGMIFSDFKIHFNHDYNYIDFIENVFIWKKADGKYYDFTKRKQLSNLINTT